MSNETLEEKPSRPNPGRELTEDKRREDDEMVFYYSRERRLAKAPPQVRALYEEAPKKFNLLRPLIATKPLAMLFATVLILSAISAILAFSGIAGGSYRFQGNSITVNAQRYQGTVIVTIQKKPDQGEQVARDHGVVDIVVRPTGGGEGAGFSHRLVFGSAEEEFRMVVPFDSPELSFRIQGASELLEFKVKTQ